jgi:hypothetical protein
MASPATPTCQGMPRSADRKNGRSARTKRSRFRAVGAGSSRSAMAHNVGTTKLGVMSAPPRR